MANDTVRGTSVLKKPGADLNSLMDSMTGQKPAREMVEVVPEGSLIRREDGSLVFKGYVMNALGLQGEGTEQDWKDLGDRLFEFEGRLALYVGDWLVTGERKFGITYEAIAEHYKRRIQTLYNWRYVCNSVEISRRREKLTFSHYAAVAGLEPHTQADWLDYADKHGVSVHRLEKEIDAWLHPNGKETRYQSTPLPGFSDKKQIKTVDTTWERLKNWQKGLLPMSDKQAREEIIAIIQFLDDQLQVLPDRDNPSYHVE